VANAWSWAVAYGQSGKPVRESANADGLTTASAKRAPSFNVAVWAQEHRQPTLSRAGATMSSSIQLSTSGRIVTSTPGPNPVGASRLFFFFFFFFFLNRTSGLSSSTHARLGKDCLLWLPGLRSIGLQPHPKEVQQCLVRSSQIPSGRIASSFPAAEIIDKIIAYAMTADNGGKIVGPNCLPNAIGGCGGCGGIPSLRSVLVGSRHSKLENYLHRHENFSSCLSDGKGGTSPQQHPPSCRTHTNSKPAEWRNAPTWDSSSS